MPAGPDPRHSRGGNDDAEPTLDPEHRARLSADAELVARLARDGFAGVGYEKFQDRLAKYGWSVMMALLASGEIFERCRGHRLGLPPPPRRLQYEDRVELANDTIVPGLRSFRERALVGGEWDVSKGATLTTFFVGKLPWHFANAYRRWCKKAAATGLEEPREALEIAKSLALTKSSADPYSVVAQYEEIVDGLAELDDTTARVLVLTWLGYLQVEIADLLGLTARAVEGVLRRHRHRIRRQGEGEL